MKFKNCILINFVKDAQMDGHAQSNMPLQLFQSWGHKNYKIVDLNYIYTQCSECTMISSYLFHNRRAPDKLLGQLGIYAI